MHKFASIICILLLMHSLFSGFPHGCLWNRIIKTKMCSMCIWCIKVCQSHIKIFTFSKQSFNESLYFVTVHSLINYTKLIDSCQVHLPWIRFKHQIHSPEVTQVLWLTASHTWVAHAKQVICLLHWLSVFTLAVPLFGFTPQQYC